MLKKEYFILGCGTFGATVAKHLDQAGVNIVVVDNNKEVIEKAGKKYSYAICADTTNIDVLKDLGIAKAACIILGISNVEDSITTCANLIQLGVQGVIIGRAKNELHARVLRTLGVERVSLPIQESAELVALRALYNFTESVYSLDHSLSWTKVTVANEECTLHPIKILNLRNTYHANILYVLHNDKLIFPVDPNMHLAIGDIVAIMCPDGDLNEAINYFSGLNTKKHKK